MAAWPSRRPQTSVTLTRPIHFSFRTHLGLNSKCELPATRLTALNCFDLVLETWFGATGLPCLDIWLCTWTSLESCSFEFEALEPKGLQIVWKLRKNHFQKDLQ